MRTRDLRRITAERPLICAAESVRGILAGSKTQTRRLYRARVGDNVEDAHGPLASLPSPFGSPGDRLWVREAWQAWQMESYEYDEWRAVTPDGGRWADHLATNGQPDRVEYRATSESSGPWSSPLFMPRWASRLTLEITEVRVQRLHEISDEDARAEGVEPYTPPHGHISLEQRVPGPGFDRCRLGDQPHRLPFADRWDSVNGKRRRREYLEIGHPDRRSDRPWRTVVDESAAWSANPWVWAITFRRVP